MEVEQPAKEAADEDEVLAPVRERRGARLGLLKAIEQVRKIVADRDDPFARRGFADEVGDQQTDEEFALDRGEVDRCLCPSAESV
jgi:hypothetical protein